MDLEPIDSDAIDGVSYDAASRTLTVKFESGGVYEYFDVDPSLFEELQHAQPHPWSVVGEEVKSHRFRRLA
ncbi:MAG TPA: KTSC domain-containing protein [Homoserinimonas sp.]|nr:KTSC domain-containing protein [Homoserinimonas sp.]